MKASVTIINVINMISYPIKRKIIFGSYLKTLTLRALGWYSQVSNQLLTWAQVMVPRS